MPVSLTDEKVAGGVILKTFGYVDGAAGKVIRERAATFLEQGVRNVILDFTQTPIVNSEALGELVELLAVSLEETEIQFFIFGLSDVCRTAFHLTGIFNFAMACASREDALKAISG